MSDETVQSVIDQELQGIEVPVPDDLANLWSADPPRHTAPVPDLLPPVPEKRPVPSKEQIEAKINELREAAARARPTVAVVANPWAKEFDPFEHPLSRQRILLASTLKVVAPLRGKVKVTCSLTGEHLVRVEGRAEDVLPLVDKHPKMFRHAGWGHRDPADGHDPD